MQMQGWVQVASSLRLESGCYSVSSIFLPSSRSQLLRGPIAYRCVDSGDWRTHWSWYPCLNHDFNEATVEKATDEHYNAVPHFSLLPSLLWVHLNKRQPHMTALLVHLNSEFSPGRKTPSFFCCGTISLLTEDTPHQQLIFFYRCQALLLRDGGRKTWPDQPVFPLLHVLSQVYWWELPPAAEPQWIQHPE